MNRLFLIALTAIFFSACHTTSDYDKVFKDPNLYCYTVHQLNSVVMGNNFGPIVASRNYLYAAVAGYEVMAAGNPAKWRSLAGQLHGLQPVPQPTAGAPVDFELASLLAYCKLGEAVTFPEGSMHAYVDSLLHLAKDHGMPDNMYKASIGYADTVA
ncbi:MAG TPA: phosphoesterase PA-phosphatase, partial [Puia sp.]|nr:phosphoesterase PA-phosphatase [Puia sp.]